MGQDKAFLDFYGKTFLRTLAEKLSKRCSQLIVSANREEEIYRWELEGIEFDFVKDLYPYEGPLNAISSVADCVKNDFVFISTCDTPFLNENLIDIFIKEIDRCEAVIPIIEGNLQPLNTLYTKNAVIKSKHLFGKTKSLIGWIESLNHKLINQQKIQSIDKDLLSYTSINTPQDYNKYIRKI